jgi:tRNA pseudouridine55 synthase
LLTQEHLLSGHTFFVNKALTWTSFNVVAKIRNTARIKKVGHAGTLDPLATGVLIVCTGKSTKKINEYMGMEKEYTGTITLGATTPSFDLESDPEDFKDYTFVNKELIDATLPQFIGLIEQMPPKYSAIKINGKRAYKLARKGDDVELKARPITIKEFEITEINLPVLSFRIVCSTGTYIRSIANDLGAALGCGGYLSALCRTRIGEYTLSNCQPVEDIVDEINAAKETT